MRLGIIFGRKGVFVVKARSLALFKPKSPNLQDKIYCVLLHSLKG